MPALDQRIEQSHLKINSNLDIISADKNLYCFLNNSATKTIIGNITKEDAIKLKEFMSKIEESSSKYYTLDMNVRDKDTLCLLEITKIKDYYDIVLYDIYTMSSSINNVLTNFKKMSAILRTMALSYFDYNIKNDLISITSTQALGVLSEFHFQDFKNHIARHINISLEPKNKIVLDKLIKDCSNSVADCTYQFENRDKKKVRIVTTQIIDSHNELSNIIGVIFKDEENLSSSTSFTHMLDGLTGVANKKTATEYGINKIDICKKDTTIIVIDIDDFKYFNDSYGHLFGDEVLIRVSRAITEAVSDYGIVGRIGGDEFIAIIDKTNDEFIIRDIARNIRLGIQWSFASDMPSLVLTSSIGIARYPKDTDCYQKTFDLADKALYIAKRKGKDCYIIYKPELHDSILIDKNTIEKHSYAGASIFTDVEKEIEILLACHQKKNGWFSKVINEVNSLLKITKTTIYDENLDLKYIFGVDTNDTRKVHIKKDNYFEYFNEYNVLINDNINKYEVSDREKFLMYFENKVCSCVEYKLVDSEGKLVGVVCYDLYKPARLWNDKDVNFLSIISRIIEDSLIKNLI